MSNSYKQRYFRRLKSEIGDVKKDIKEVDSLYTVTQIFFSEAVSKYAKDKKLANPLLKSTDDSPPEEDRGDITPSEAHNLFSEEGSSIKSLWRQVLVKSHPDKNSQESEDIQDERTEVYQNTVKAKKKWDLHSVIEAAKSLDVDIPDITFEHLSFLEKQLKKIKADLEKIYNSYPWVYYFSNDKRREFILQSFFNQHSNV